MATDEIPTGYNTPVPSKILTLTRPIRPRWGYTPPMANCSTPCRAKENPAGPVGRRDSSCLVRPEGFEPPTF